MTLTSFRFYRIEYLFFVIMFSIAFFDQKRHVLRVIFLLKLRLPCRSSKITCNRSHLLNYFVLQAFPVSNIMCLYGLHQRYLNNLVSRYYEKMIKDFFR